MEMHIKESMYKENVREKVDMIGRTEIITLASGKTTFSTAMGHFIFIVMVKPM
jgi:hypothetical protein